MPDWIGMYLLCAQRADALPGRVFLCDLDAGHCHWHVRGWILLSGWLFVGNTMSLSGNLVLLCWQLYGHSLSDGLVLSIWWYVYSHCVHTGFVLWGFRFERCLWRLSARLCLSKRFFVGITIILSGGLILSGGQLVFSDCVPDWLFLFGQ